MTKIDKEHIKKMVKLADPNLEEDDETFTVAMVLIASLHKGPDMDKIADFLELDVEDLRLYEDNLRNSEVWKDGKIHIEWLGDEDEETSFDAIPFWCDVMVAQGLLNRSKEVKSPDSR